ncbi:unnamed protein product [Clonostachys rosea]|uniref:Uncharacterized protein n=1 Tax=Bionectria ochroleuca TaxID=29856 RepID=A0ABY6TQE6_BIOOC|nr:unnamed protein product [Clonostachys rosea]
MADLGVAALGSQNATNWTAMTAWTANLTRYAPSMEDLVWACPRMFKRLGSFMVPSDAQSLNESISQLAPNPAAVGADLLRTANATFETLMDLGEGGTAGGAATAEEATVRRLSLEGARSFGGVFSYVTSKWALACIVMAVVLNRTHIYAATRRRLQLRWTVRLALRIVPIIWISVNAVRLLQSIQCQTSPDFAELRWGNSSMKSDLMFSYNNPFFNRLGATILGATDEQSCRSVKMILSEDDDNIQHIQGSLSALWPLFLSFCLSNFIESVSCTVQGRPHASEVAMSLFEQSLAFAEADAAISSQLSWSSFTKGSGVKVAVNGTTIALTRSMIMNRVNTAPEVLWIAFLCAITHVTSHLLGVFDLQAKFRLYNTGIWAFCFIGTFVWSTVTFDLDDPATQGLLRFPAVCIIGMIPHILVLFGIIICFSIYGVALILSALSSRGDDERASMSFRQRLIHAHQNMQANISLSEIRITREMDIYTALLRTGFTAVTMASEAVYLNEDRGVSVQSHTWLDNARLQEAEEMQRNWSGLGLTNSQYDNIGAIGLVPVQGKYGYSANGYARERAAQKVPKGGVDRSIRNGVGAAERSARWLMALELFLTVHRLFARISALILLWMFRVARIRSQPAWLLQMANRSTDSKEGKNEDKSKDGPGGPGSKTVDENPLARPENQDIEAEFRRSEPSLNEEHLESELYAYWLRGGWWGGHDSSGDFRPAVNDDDWDTTSVVTATTTDGDSQDEYAWESEEDGQRTPTGRSPRRSRDESSVIDSPFSMNDFARLLQPKSREEREHARNLAAHLQSDKIMTRSQYRRIESLQRTRILTNPGSGPTHDGVMTAPGRGGRKLSPEDEERVLEQLLLARRQSAAVPSSMSASSWQDGAAGLGSGGPPCVVCQSSPRSIIVWPCRCLSLCDECRVSLAINNFDKCVCCRRDVISFSRIFVP